LLGAEVPAKGEKLLVDERLDGAGVDRASTEGERMVMEGGCHQRLSGARWGIQDDVLAVEKIEDGLFLGRVKLQFVFFHKLEKSIQEGVVSCGPFCG
jgi:hypothetical protein